MNEDDLCLPRSGLALVEGNESRDKTHTKPSEESAGEEQGEGRGRSLQDNTQNEDDSGGNEGQSATNVVGQEGRRKSTKEGAC